MHMVSYDGSFEGFLTAIFEIYEYRITDPMICNADAAPGSLFGGLHAVHTNHAKSDRIYKKMKEKMSGNSLGQYYKTFLSGEKGVEDILYRYFVYVLSSKTAVDNDFSNPDVLFVQQMSRKVHREKHRMEAFVRFQLTGDGLYYALIQPDFNVLPLVSSHFEKRYADQRWLIYDTRRNYGLYFDLERVDEVNINFDVDLGNEHALKGIYDEKETLYQHLWQQYFQSVNIKARKNTKLHIQHMPRRYWKYLVEKHVPIRGGQ